MIHSLSELAKLRASHYLVEVKRGTFPALDLPTLTRLVVTDVEQIVSLDMYEEPLSDGERAEIAIVCDRMMNEGW